MKIKARLFVFLALFALAILPSINFALNHDSKKQWSQWWSKTALYNFDSVLPYVSQVFYQIGVSISPSNVVIGKNGWLFLGDAHEQSITRQRADFASDHSVEVSKIKSSSVSRAEWLNAKGVQQFLLIICPDKSTVYNDQLPNWAMPTDSTFTDRVVLQSQAQYLDTRLALKTARSRYAEPLYFKTDTHWNKLGGWIAYLALGRRLLPLEPNLVWFSDDNIKKSIVPRVPGDLANFLRMTQKLQDTQVAIDIDKVSTSVGEHYLLEGNVDIKNGNLAGQVAQKVDPLIFINSKDALNKKRVLWLHDSFGDAMGSYM